MRRLILSCIAAASLAACSSETTAPDTSLAIDAGLFGTALTQNGGYDARLYQDRLFNALPDEIALSDDQKAKIRSFVADFIEATKSDREALGKILQEAHAAVRAGKSRAEIHAILERGAALRQRLHDAERGLVADIQSVLTAEQKAWLAAHRPERCDPSRFPPLTDAQKAQIQALEQSFRDNNKADLDAMRAIVEEAGAAIRSGKSRDEIAAIFARGATIARRLAEARRDLREDILGVLTPEQRASRCLPLG
ncbi:MAG: Spy/CpxP family protein refolding chaperone [Gemmatimonadaceae bacterium]